MPDLTKTFRPASAFRALLLSMFTIGLSYGLYKGVLDNYLAEIVSMSEFDKGVSEFFRELPGLLVVFILAALFTFSAERLFKIGAFIMVIGMLLHAALPASRVYVTAAIFVYSLGEHLQLAMRQTLSLEYAQKGKGGEAMGIQSASHQIGNLAGYLIIIAAFLFVQNSQGLFRVVFLASTAIALISFAVSLRMTGSSKTDRSKSRFYFRNKYRKYYMLEVFYGARKQIFLTFGPYVLVLFYGADTAVISLLFAISAVCTFVASPLVGKIIDRIGYKIVMISDTLILVIVCFFYGFAHHLFPMHIAFVVCCANYVLDSVISLASMASSVYVQDLSESQEEVKATLSTGLSVNHLITIGIALFGGWIWQTLGIETLFILSAILGLCNSAYAASIRVPKTE